MGATSTSPGRTAADASILRQRQDAPGEREPCIAGELLEEDPLDPPIAHTKRMNRVDLAQVIGQPAGEGATFQARRKFSLRSARKMPADEDSM